VWDLPKSTVERGPGWYSNKQQSSVVDRSQSHADHQARPPNDNRERERKKKSDQNVSLIKFGAL
jgi:hypothetical protein